MTLVPTYALISGFLPSSGENQTARRLLPSLPFSPKVAKSAQYSNSMIHIKSIVWVNFNTTIRWAPGWHFALVFGLCASRSWLDVIEARYTVKYQWSIDSAIVGVWRTLLTVQYHAAFILTALGKNLRRNNTIFPGFLLFSIVKKHFAVIFNSYKFPFWKFKYHPWQGSLVVAISHLCSKLPGSANRKI